MSNVPDQFEYGGYFKYPLVCNSGTKHTFVLLEHVVAGGTGGADPLFLTYGNADGSANVTETITPGDGVKSDGVLVQSFTFNSCSAT